MLSKCPPSDRLTKSLVASVVPNSSITVYGSPNAGLLQSALDCAGLPSHQPNRTLNTVIDRKSTRLNSSHLGISYAVFCLIKKKNIWLAYRDDARALNEQVAPAQPN